ncbi:MAG: N-acetyltransferase [Acidobacteria bacterium]|nr:N-acetyltransferase [Acidobacteriota bacterium]
MISVASPNRRADADDIADLLRLEKECFTGYYEPHRYDREQFLHYLDNPKSILLVANHHDHTAGYILGISSKRGERTGAYIHSIAVEKGSRRAGLGETLLGGFLDEAARRSCAFASLEVAAENRAGVRLFEKFGFSKTRDLPDYYGEGHSGVRMSKLL